MSAPLPSKPDKPSNIRKPVRQLMVSAILFCLILFTWFYIRGSWATKNPTDPASPADGVKSVIVQKDGKKEIRTSVVIPVSVENAWSIISNYEEWERLFSTIHRLDPETGVLDNNRHHVVSDVMTPLGMIKLDFIVTHENTADGGYVAWWDAPTEELPINRGEIRVTPKGSEQTLLVYSIDKQYRKYPQFAVYNVLLGHQTDLVSTLRKRIIEAANKQ